MQKFFVVFLAFIFLFSCNSAKPEKFEPKIPTEIQSPLTDAAPENATIINVHSGGKISVDGKETGTVNDTKNMREELKNLTFLQNPQATKVFIKAARNTKYVAVAKIIDEVKSLGIETIGLQIMEADE